MSKLFIDKVKFNPFNFHELSEADDMNNVLQSGFYVTRDTNPKNFPTAEINEGRWATVIVYNHDNGQILQQWIIQGRTYNRWLTTSTPSNGIGTPQTDWIKVATQTDLESLQSQINDLKKKIGGVTRHLYARLISALATSTEMEVA